MNAAMLAVLIGSGVAIATSLLVAVFTMVTMQRLQKPDYLHRMARKYTTSPVMLC